MNQPIIRVDVRVREAEADGSECAHCGEMIFLKAWRIEVQAGRMDKPTVAENLLCDSCKSVLFGDG